jgi:hypothetical protein
MTNRWIFLPSLVFDWKCSIFPRPPISLGDPTQMQG